MGPCIYTVIESDFNPPSRCNILIKCLDDSNRLVPEHTECTQIEEFTHICDWAQHNKTRINITETKELVFHRPHPTKLDKDFVLTVCFQQISSSSSSSSAALRAAQTDGI